MRKCTKTVYKSKKTVRRAMERRNKDRGRTGGSFYHCTRGHKGYHITRQDPIDPKLWKLIKNDPQVQGGGL